MATAATLPAPFFNYPKQDVAAPLRLSAHTNGTDNVVHFDPAKHLRFEPPPHVYSLDDIKYPKDPHQVGTVAATDPFPLFTKEAVIEMRRQLLAPRTIKNCMTYTRQGSVQIRGAGKLPL